LSANNYTAASGKCAVGFSPLPEISGISIVMYVSELFVGEKCITGSLVHRTFARERHLLFLCYCNLPQPQIRGFQYSFLIIHIKRNSSSSLFIR